MASKEIQKRRAGTDVPAVIQEELDAAYNEMIKGGGFTLPQVKITHESQRFEMPGGDAPKSFQGILLGEQRFNIYWEKSGDDDDEVRPPDCVAMDARNGSQYGPCAQCAHNRFGSAPDGQGGKACANKSALLIWPTDHESALPYVLTVSPASLEGRTDRSRAGTQIATFGAPQRIPEVGIVAEFTLEKATRGQQVFSKLIAKPVGTYKDGALTTETVQQALAIRKQFKDQLKARAEELETQTVDPDTGDAEQHMETETEEPPWMTEPQSSGSDTGALRQHFGDVNDKAPESEDIFEQEKRKAGGSPPKESS